MLYYLAMTQASFIFGEESFLVEEDVRRMIAPFGINERDVFEGVFDLKTLLQASSMSGLFSTQKILILKNPWFLSKAVSDADIELLKQCLTSALSAGHSLLIYQLGAVDQRKKVAGLLKKQCLITHHQGYKDWEQDKVLQWITTRAKHIGKDISREAALALEVIGGTNLRQLAGELDKCSIYIADKPKISAEDVKALCASATTSIFDFNEAMKKHNTSKMIESLTRLLDHGDDPVMLLGLSTANIRLYTQLIALSSEGLSSDAIAKAIGKNPYFIQKLIPDVKRAYSLATLKKAYTLLAEADLAIKSGKKKPKIALELAILSI
jgi:DNA polymerase III subunit delta